MCCFFEDLLICWFQGAEQRGGVKERGAEEQGEGEEGRLPTEHRAWSQGSTWGLNLGLCLMTLRS